MTNFFTWRRSKSSAREMKKNPIWFFAFTKIFFISRAQTVNRVALKKLRREKKSFSMSCQNVIIFETKRLRNYEFSEFCHLFFLYFRLREEKSIELNLELGPRPSTSNISLQPLLRRNLLKNLYINYSILFNPSSSSSQEKKLLSIFSFAFLCSYEAFNALLSEHMRKNSICRLSYF